MRLQELKKREVPQIDEAKAKTISVFLGAFLYKLSGDWYWELETEAVFCSDVMISLPPNVIGTKAIFHPDDLEAIRNIVTNKKESLFFEFRIITSYGDVKTLTGENVKVEDDKEGLNKLQKGFSEQIIQQLQLKKELEHLQILQQATAHINAATSTGTWYYNLTAGNAWFDDTVFLMHGLPPQSINSHLHIFHPFIHPEDKDMVVEYSDKAFRERTPLHLEYRIVVNEKEKWIRYTSGWMFTEKGDEVFSGVLQDITSNKAIEKEAESFKALAAFQKQQLAFDEKQANIGHWQLNLLTRKAGFSDQYYRIFGIKPQSLPAHINVFLHYIHPDDQDMVEAVLKKVIYEHAIPDIEYRVQRADGKLRYVKQTGRLVTSEGVLVVTGLLEDITVQRLLERKITEVNEEFLSLRLLQKQVDETGSTAGWVMEIQTGNISWSDGIYPLLGYKTQVIEMKPKTLFSFIHPHDVKSFKEYWNLAVQEKQETVFTFKLLLRGAVRHMKAIFRIHATNEKMLFIGTVQDISVEQILQEHLWQRVQLAESLTENILDRVLITDENNTIVLWNKASEKAYGLKKEEAIGQNFFDVFPHLKTEDEMQSFLKALRGETVHREEQTSGIGNGYFNLHLMPLRKEKNNAGILHIVRDVTKEVELRKSLQDRLLFIERLIESSVDRIIALDKNMTYQYWNHSAEKYYGIRKEDVVGKNILDVFPQLVSEPAYGAFRKVLSGETVHLAADSEKGKFFETYLIPVKGEKGEIATVLWIAHDLKRELELMQKQKQVQEQLREEHRLLKQAEEKLVESERWLKQTAITSPDCIVIYEIETKHQVYLNNCLAEWTGYSMEELGNTGTEKRLKLVHPDDRLPLLHFIEMIALAADGKILTLEYRVQKKDNTALWVRNRSKVFQRNEQGKVTHILTILQDITKARQAEQDLKQLNESLQNQNRDLESKNEEITSFAFVASHDLKEPIRKLHTFTDWLMTREEGISNMGRTSLEKMTVSIKRLDSLIDDILVLSKAQFSNKELKKVDLNLLLQNVKDELKEEIEKSGVQIEAPDLPTLTGDKNLLFSLFINLVSNSIKFQPKGNTPKISIASETVMEENKKGIQLSFSDNGIGFTQAYSKKIFLIFQRLNGREEYEGTGMGLAICKKIMEKHNGTITAVSEPGKGATFTCWFPL
jgi:PAS domain S-box-containing protein